MKFREVLPRVMDRKNHWARPFFSSPDASLEPLRIHFEQECLSLKDRQALAARRTVETLAASPSVRAQVARALG